MVIELPIGIQQSDGTWTKEVEIEELSGYEEDILSDLTRTTGGKGTLVKSSSTRMTEVLSSCTVRIGSETRPNGKTRESMPGYFEPHWTKAFMSDRGFALIRLRQNSLGDKYKFSEQCPECGKIIQSLSVDLSELAVTSLPLSVIEENKGIFSLKTTYGNEIVWKVLRGEDEDKLSSIRRQYQDSILSALMLVKTMLINGKTPSIKELQKLKAKERAQLRKEFDEKEGGIEVEVTIDCDNPDCRHTFVRFLNTGSKDFFFPLETS